jgi:DHA1 family multidrug resistance protein-like MFS transporter
MFRQAADAPSSEQSQQQSLGMLLVFTFFMVLGFTMIMPLVLIQYVHNLGFAVSSVAAALALRQLLQQGLAVLGGILADKVEIRSLICAGVLLRVAGFVCLAYASNLLLLLLAMILIALGGVLFETPYQTAIATLTSDENRPRYYSLNNVVVGVATSSGPLLGVLLLRANFQVVCLGAAACFAITFIVARWYLPVIVRPSATKAVISSFKGILRDRPFMLLTGLMIMYWLAAAQINISFPLIAEQLTSSPDSVGVLFALYAIITALFQYPLIRLLERFLQAAQSVALGVVVIALSLLAMSMVSSYVWFLLLVVVFTLGVLLSRPHQQSLAVAHADQQVLGMYLGINALGLALGGSIGTLLGGYLFELAAQTGLSALPWFVFSAIAFACALGFAYFGRFYQQSTAPMLAQESK